MTDPKHLWQRSASDIVSDLKADQISILEALDSIESRIQNVNSAINALPTHCFERARKNAQRLQSLPADQRGPLAGLPVTIKDLTCVEGVRTTFGCVIYKENVPSSSCQMVQRIENNGGVVYAKSNTPEFGTGGITFNDVFGITRSPYNLKFASGGSSGGAAAALASGCAWLSHGSDMAGSLRTPASFCGVTSLRPSPGVVPSDSEYGPYSILGQEGPMARNIADLSLFFEAMQGNSLGIKQKIKPQETMRVALSENLGIATIDEEIREAFKAFSSLLANSKHQIEHAAPDLTDVHQTFDVLRAHEYAIGLEQTYKDYPDVMKPEVEWNIRSGQSLSSEQLREATRNQGQIINNAARFMQDYDVLICPATSVTSVPAEHRYPGSESGVPYADYYRWLAIAYATTVTALPIITLPFAISSSGIPMGIQLLGKPYSENALLAIAREIEKLIDWNTDPIDPIGVS